MCMHMYVLGSAHSPADQRAHMLLFLMLAEFCPEPGSHIGQPVAFDETDEEDEEDEIPDAEWQWDVGVSNATWLRTTL